MGIDSASHEWDHQSGLSVEWAFELSRTKFSDSEAEVEQFVSLLYLNLSIFFF